MADGLIQIPLTRYNEMKEAADKANNRVAELHGEVERLEGQLEAIKGDLDEYAESSLFERTFGWNKLKAKIQAKHGKEGV